MSGPAPTVTRSDRMLRAFRALVAAETPRLTFLGIYEYSVQTSTGTACDVSPTDTTLSLPALQAIPLRLSAMTATPAAGQKVLVFFINGDPTRPAIFNTDPIPTTAAIDATSAMSVGASAGSVVVGGGSSSVSLAGGSSPTGQLTFATSFATLVGTMQSFANALATCTTIAQVSAAGGTLNTALGPILTGAYRTTKTTAA